MNDLINNVLQRYESFKKGDRSATIEIDPASVFATPFQGISANVSDRSFQKKGSKSSSRSAGKAAAAPAPNLIDFDFDAPATSGSSNGQNASNPMDDFAGLSLGGPSSTLHPSGSGNDLLAGLNFSSSTSSMPTQPPFYQQYQTPLPSNLSANQQQSMSWGNLNTSTPSVGSGQASPAFQANRAGSMMSPPPTQGARSSTPGAITLGMMGSMPGTPTSAAPSMSGSANGGFGQFSQAPAQANYQPQRQQPPPAAKAKDPFEDVLM